MVLKDPTNFKFLIFHPSQKLIELLENHVRHIWWLLFTGWPADLTDHRDVIFPGSDKVYSTGKNGHLLHRPNHWWIGGPFPKDYWSPCPSGCCHLVPVLVRHGGHSTLP